MPMPSALRSGGGSLLSSVPGGAIGDPLSATNSFVPSGLTLMPLRPLAERDRRDNLIGAAVDDGQVAADFVRDVDVVRRLRRFRRGCRRRRRRGLLLRLAAAARRERRQQESAKPA